MDQQTAPDSRQKMKTPLEGNGILKGFELNMLKISFFWVDLVFVLLIYIHRKDNLVRAEKSIFISMSRKGDESPSSDIDSSLPYNGNLQEAIRNRDREAVKCLMKRRESDNGSGDFSESKTEYRNVLCDALVSLGFSKMQVTESLTATSSQARALKSLLDSKRHFPSPPSNRKGSHDTQDHKDDNLVTSHMLASLDPDSTFTLLQCCVDNPGIQQTAVFSILKRLISLHTSNILSSDACAWMRSVLIGGYIEEVQCLLTSLTDMHLSSTSLPTGALTESPGGADHLLQSYICPITREILIEPVTLQVLQHASCV